MLLACVIVTVLPSFAIAERFDVPEHGSLFLDVPSGWKSALEASGMSLPPTIKFTPVNGDDFVMLITPLWSQKSDANFNSKEVIERKVKDEGIISLKQSVETKLRLYEFKGEQAYGYYYKLTDKSLVGKKRTPGDYKQLLRSLVGVEDLLLSVTVLSHEADSVHVDKAIKMIAGATKRK